ncbi:MAG: peptidase S41 [Gammaproteobacteria bacterium]|nr:MAG: peptidase S41 [Gammaproteobacteria bacterium]
MINHKKRTCRHLGLAVILALPLGLQAKSTAALPLDEIRNFVDVYHIVKNEYVEEKDGKTLIDFAIKGMLDGLDPHSAYLEKSQLKDYREDANGSYLGFGVSWTISNGKLIIIAPIADSPAEKAGIKANDRVVKIDNTVIENMSMSDIDKLLKDKEEVSFTITDSSNKDKVVKLKRTTINLPSVTAKILDKDYGYIQINQFQDNTTKQFEEALTEQLDKKVKGVIVDLRNNPGGLVYAATDIADLFLDAGLIVSTKNPNTGSEEKVHAEKDTTIAKDIPLVILINEGSASASEILTGALQSHKRALVVGQPSFGKGSVQSIVPLSNGDAVKLTVARYYTPNGDSIQAKGITPDIILSQLSVEEKEVDLLSYNEADIAGHLSAESPKTGKDNENKKDKKTDKNKKKTPRKGDLSATSLAKSDLQLFEALNVLKVKVLVK